MKTLLLLALLLATALGSSHAATFTVRPEFPATDGRVYAIAIDEFNRVLYLGGTFDHVGGQPRSRLAAINLDTGALLPFAPVIDDTVLTLAFTGVTLYAGGQFTTVDATTRKRAAAFNTNDGTLLAWNPNVADGTVLTLAVDVGTNTVFLGGTFTQVGAIAAFRLANVNATTGTVANWTPNPEAAVNAIATYNGFAYTGGDFTTIGGRPYRHLATLDGAGDGSAFFGWSPDPDGTVRALLFDGTKLYLAGDFVGFPTLRPGLARVDRSTGILDTDFANLVLLDRVNALALTGTHLYFGGGFTTVKGEERRYVASVDTATSELSLWNPAADNYIDALAVSGYTVFVGGAFTSIGGASRQGFAALIDPTLPGAPTPSRPTLTVTGKRVLSTKSTALKIKGTSSGATKVQFKVPARAYRSAHGVSKWNFTAPLRHGRNLLLVRAMNAAGQSSAVIRLTITRK